MSPEEYRQQLDKQIERLKSGEAMKTAVVSTHTRVARRIFVKGLKSDGTPIGEYNTTSPLYVNPLTGSPKKFPPAGKPYGGKKGREVFASTGKPHKTGYFESYKAFRDKIGKNNKTVNLNLFGILQRDFASGLQQESNSIWYEGVKQEGSADKIVGNEKRFGEIFKHTKDEEEFFVKVLNRELTKQ